MKKILFVLNADWYFDLHWKERACNAIENGFLVSVALPYCSDEIRISLGGEGIEVHEFIMNRTETSIAKELNAIHSLNKIFDQVGPDIVHSVTIKPNLYCSFLCCFKGIPLVSTYAGLGTLKISNSIKHKVIKGFIFHSIKLLSKKINLRALFENQDDLKFFEENTYLPRCKMVRVFGAGVNLEHYSYKVSAFQSGSLNVLFASRLLKDKGLIPLVEAVKLVKRSGITVNLYVAGIYDFESPLAFSEEEILNLEKEGDIIWLGKRDDIPSLIANSDVVALPTSYGEGVPRILIEACAVGRPIITTELGGCKDICKHRFNGYLVAPNNPNEIALSMEELYLNPELIDRFGLNGRDLIENGFSNKSIFSQNISIYNQLLEL
jgi:glycosyltransferase involved in cell wall biosynthesis